MGSGVFDLTTTTIPLPARVASLAPRRRGRREAARRPRPSRGDRDRVPDGPRRGASPGDGPRRARRAACDRDVAVARRGRQLLRRARRVPPPRRRGLRRGRHGRRRARARPARGPGIPAGAGAGRRLPSLALLAAGRRVGSCAGDALVRCAGRQARGGRRRSPGLAAHRRPAARARRRPDRDLSHGTGQPAGTGALRALRRRARLRAGRARHGGRPAAALRARRGLRGRIVRESPRRSSASSRARSRARSPRACTTRSSVPAGCRGSTCRCRSPTSSARIRRRSTSIRRSADSP